MNRTNFDNLDDSPYVCTKTDELFNLSSLAHFEFLVE